MHRHTTAALAAFLGCSLHAFSADVAAGSGKTGELKPADRTPTHAPKNTPDAAVKNLAKAKLPEGFTASIWASEPLLANTVAFSFDGQGRMFTAETNRYRSSVLDIRHYMFMLEDDLASRNQADWTASIKKNFPKDWQELGKETETIRVLEDSNGDGKADQSRIFADGFHSILDGIASGVLAHNGSVYFTNIPALWKMDGLGADGRAGKREEMFRGFGIRFSYTGHDFHGLIVGPDGRLYFSIGDRAASVKTKEGTSIELPDEGGVFRCELDGSHLELVMRGLRNPQELAFDDYGNLFTGDNDSDQGDRERWVNIVEGADAGWRIGYQHNPLGKDRNPWLAEHQWEPRDAAKKQPYAVLSPIANLPDGPSGLTHYPGTGLPASYAGSFFLCGFKGSTAKSAISTFKSEPSGAGFKLTGLTTFMNNVQATDVDFGPDSRLYVSAWDEGWERTDQSRIYRLENTEAVKAQAKQIAEVKTLLAEGFQKKPPEELAKLLGHWDQRVRLGAQWALAEMVAAEMFESVKKKQINGAVNLVNAYPLFELIQKTAMEGVPGPGQRLSRIHAIWLRGHAARIFAAKCLVVNGTAINEFTLDEVGRKLFADPDSEIRAQRWRTIADSNLIWPDELKKLAAKSLADPEPRVRFFAAMALAKHGDASAMPAVLTMLRANDDKDETLRHAGVMALTKCADAAALAAAAKDTSRAVRLAVLLAYRRLGSEQIAQFLHDTDADLVREAAHAINDAPINEAMPALAALAFSKPSGSAVPMDGKDEPLALRVLNANFRIGTNDGANALALFAVRGSVESLRVEALELLAQWRKPPARDRVLGIYRPLPERGPSIAAFQLALVAADLLADKSERVVVATCRALEANGVKDAAPHLLKTLQTSSATIPARIAALQTLAALDAKELPAAIAAASADASPALKTAASKFLAKTDPALAATQLAAAYADAAIAEKKVILEALGDNPSPKADAALAELVGTFDKQPRAVQLELLDAAGKRKSPAVAAALAAWQAALPKDSPQAALNVCLEGGDKVVGEKLFKEGAVSACLRCHKVAGSGGEAGPDLSKIAATKDRAYILESIIAPNAKIAEGFQTILVTLKNGDVQAGIVKAETADEITLLMPMPDAQPVKVKVADIKSRENAPSGMPPGFDQLLSKSDLRDLVEYVASLR